MGDVNEAVHGSKKLSPKLVEGNLNERMQALLDEVSELTMKKDQDVLDEGDAAKAENVRKAALLRSASSLLRATKRLLEDY